MERANGKSVIRRGLIEGGVNEKCNSRAFGHRTDCFRTGGLCCAKRIEQDTRPRDATKGCQEGYAWCVRLLAGTPDAGQRLQEGSSWSFRLRARPDNRSKHKRNERSKLDDHQVDDHQVKVAASRANAWFSCPVGTAALGHEQRYTRGRSAPFSFSLHAMRVPARKSERSGPAGKSLRFSGPAPFAKYIASHFPQIKSITRAVSSHEEGRSRSSRTRGEMRWTLMCR
jgi:hypothetical protein